MRYAFLDLKRVIKRKSFYLTVLIFLASVIIQNYFVYRNFNFKEFDLTKFDILPMILSNFFAIKSSGILAMLITMFVLTDELKESGYLRPIEAGYSRNTIILSKLLVSVLLSLAFLLIVFLVHSLAIFVLYGFFSKENFDLIIIMLKYILINIPQILVFMMIPLILFNRTESDYTASLGSYFFAAFFVKILRTLGNKFNIPVLLKLVKFAPSTTTSKIANQFFEEVVIKIPKFEFIRDYILGDGKINSISMGQMMPYLGVSLVLFFILLAISLYLFNRKNLD